MGLTDDDVQTPIKKAEALNNSRPMTYEGADPQDEPVLTPNHFLVGQLKGQPSPQVTNDIPFNPRKERDNLFHLLPQFFTEFCSC